MMEDFDILSKLVKRKKPTVPEGFFSSFCSSVMPANVTPEINDGAGLTTRKKPEVPAGFFAGFHESLKTAIESDQHFENLNLKKRTKPELPENFNTDFQRDLMTKITRKKSNGRILKVTFWSTAAAIAAGLTLLFTLNTGDQNPQTQVVAKSSAADEETVDAYMAYLDEEELIDYILENEIEMGESETDDVVYDYIEEDLEEIYMEDIYGDL